MKIEKVKKNTVIFPAGGYKDEKLILLIEGTIINVKNYLFIIIYLRIKVEQIFLNKDKFSEPKILWITKMLTSFNIIM